MARQNLSAPKGMRDILPDDLAGFREVERAFRDVCRRFGYREIRTPHLEAMELFERTVGETTDIVEKEMYTLTTAGGDELALRPENTAGVVRAYLEHGFHKTAPHQRLFYWGEMFRHESSQKKRYREFTQAGVECLGSEHPDADAEVIALAAEFFKDLGVEARTEISSFGCQECRQTWRASLSEYFRDKRDELCPDCQRRLETNVFRLLDCKEASCGKLAETAPGLMLCRECDAHSQSVESMLERTGVPFKKNRRLVRGLDYYNRTVFEFFPRGSAGRQDALGAGGRYDGLAELLGGNRVPAVGFALGIDRICLELGPARSSPPDVYLAADTEEGKMRPLPEVALEIRRKGLSCVVDLSRKSLGRQLKAADAAGIGVAVVVKSEQRGNEVVRMYAVKDMSTGEQHDVDRDRLVEEVRKMLEVRKEACGRKESRR